MVRATFKRVERFDPNPNRNWKWTPTMLGLILGAGASARAKLPDMYRRMSFRQTDDVIDATVFGNTGEYQVWINLNTAQQHCDCPSFQHRDGPCKHIAAVAAVLIGERESGGPNWWVRLAVLDDRNSGRQFKRWEFRPEPSEEVARRYDAKVWSRHAGHVVVKGYVVEDKVWTGELPLPAIDDRVVAYLPTGEQVPGCIVRRFDRDPTYHAYNVTLDWTPEGYDSPDVVLFGSEILQSDNL